MQDYREDIKSIVWYINSQHRENELDVYVRKTGIDLIWNHQLSGNKGRVSRL